MIDTLFSIDIAHIDIENWKNKKIKLLKEIKKLKFERNNSFDSSRYLQNNEELIKAFIKIFDNDLNKILHECNIESINIHDMWVVKYKKGDYQSVHHHIPSTYSGILYIDLDKKQSTTTFVAPFPSMTGKVLSVSPDNIKEGSLCIFPSHLSHYVNPNSINKERVSLSFDFNFLT